MPDLSPEKASAFAADDSGGKQVCRTVMAVKRLTPSDFQLNAVVFERINDCFVTMLNVILRNLALIDLHSFFQEVDCEGFLEKGGAFVFLVLQDAHNGRGLPLLFPARSGNTRLCQCLGNVRACFAHHEGTVNIANNLGLFFDHLG